jgi:hypothetical protein
MRETGKGKGQRNVPCSNFFFLRYCLPAQPSVGVSLFGIPPPFIIPCSPFDILCCLPFPLCRFTSGDFLSKLPSTNYQPPTTNFSIPAIAGAYGAEGPGDGY